MNASATLNTAASSADPAGASPKRKIPGIRGTESPDSFGDTANKTEFYVSVFSGEVHPSAAVKSSAEPHAKSTIEPLTSYAFLPRVSRTAKPPSEPNTVV